MDEMIRIIEPMIPGLRRFARSLVNDASVADDVVQDGLEHIIRGWPPRELANARSWAFTIVHNLSMNILRRNKRVERWRVAASSVDDADLAHPATQEDTLRYKEALGALDRLSPEHKTVILLITIEDLSYEEAAHILGVPLGTVMSRLSRARQALRREIEDGPRPVRPVLRRVK